MVINTHSSPAQLAGKLFLESHWNVRSSKVHFVLRKGSLLADNNQPFSTGLLSSKALQASLHRKCPGTPASTMAVLDVPEIPKATGKPFPPVDHLQAVLFDVDGTLANSDPLHYLAFREILQEVGFQGGVPIDEEFFNTRISGRHNPDIGADLFPDWPVAERDALLVEKEARFRKVAAETLEEVKGLHRLCEWIKARGIRRVAVTNAPRENAEQMIASLGLSSFFEALVIGSECERAKPFPDPYLKGLEWLGVSPDHAFAVEDSPSGMRAAVAAGLPTIGILTGQKAPVLEAVGAAFTITDFEDPKLWEKLEPAS